MTKIQKLLKAQMLAEKELTKFRRNIDGRSYGAIINKIYQARTIKGLDKTLKKYNLSEIANIPVPSNKKRLNLKTLTSYSNIVYEYHILGDVQLTKTYHFTRGNKRQKQSYPDSKIIPALITAKSKKSYRNL